MDAINTVRRAGPSRPPSESGMITNGIMYSAVTNGVPFLLAGSIRDDGPLPEVITDAMEAQDQMRRFTQDATLVVMLATMLHSIATGNMLPTFIERNRYDRARLHHRGRPGRDGDPEADRPGHPPGLRGRAQR